MNEDSAAATVPAVPAAPGRDVAAVPAARSLAAGAARSGPATLSPGTRRRLAEARPPGTRRAYRGDLRRFLAWAAGPARAPATHAGDAPTDDTALAAGFAALLDRVGGSMPAVLAEYVNHLADAGRAPSTIDRALAAILVAHDALGAAKPSTTTAREVLRGYRRQRAASGTGNRVRKAAPVTIDVLRAMVGCCAPATPTGLRDRALLVLGFALGARRSELAALDLADVAEADNGLEVTIRISKTDRDAVGRVVAVPYGTHPQTCPVRTVRAWRAARTASGATSGPLFVRIDRHGTLGRPRTAAAAPTAGSAVRRSP